MDIEEMAWILAKNYDAIRDTNAVIENETIALEKETQQLLNDIEEKMQESIDDMKHQTDRLLEGLRQDYKIRITEFFEEIQMDMKALETGDDFERNVKNDLKTMKMDLQTDILNIKKSFLTTMEEIDEAAASSISEVRWRSKEEIRNAVENVLEDAKAGKLGSISQTDQETDPELFAEAPVEEEDAPEENVPEENAEASGGEEVFSAEIAEAIAEGGSLPETSMEATDRGEQE